MASTTMCTDIQREIFSKVEKNEATELKSLLASNKLKIDFVDENGMSPLQHACYKGNKEITQMLLDQGADVNGCQQDNGYTALHLAALSGNADLCHLLLSCGAKINATNSVARTAAQMAAFVGNHNCVATINNYIPKADIDYYVKPQGLQTEPMLPPHLSDSFHKFIMQVNVHPVRVAITLQKCTGLLDHLAKVQKVLESLRQREMTRGAETNEIMAFKYHYLSCIINEIQKLKKRQEARKEKVEKEKSPEATDKTSTKCQTDLVELFIKQLLKCNKYQEALLREIVREFPFRESTIFRQMIATLAGTDPPSAVSVVSAAINGQRGFVDLSQICITCGEEKATKKCSKCRAVQYCDRECQRYHWFLHKKECAREDTNTTSDKGGKITDADKAQLATAIQAEIHNLNIK
ncbi:ankyrin repeat and MYND domain-containing protein 2 [Fopius arisanus]|uniref:Ankyrin repeat and MYND domain-containing protein 2 n=2 Tax=Fopius arisanus TaxID=64838 RepID=A0A9R1TE28_9HYME|nr:PREDICTED: ankyrin repeat and MYND domain-containing protein 2 [Fopius arisanus]